MLHSTIKNQSQPATEYVITYEDNELYSSDIMEEQTSLGSTSTIFNPTFYNPFEIKHRRRTSRGQFKVLEKAFSDNPKPSGRIRQKLAQHLSMTPRGVQVWFQNRRAKAKQQQQQQREKNHPEDQHDYLQNDEQQENILDDLLIGDRSIYSPFQPSPAIMIQSLSHSSLGSSYQSDSIQYEGDFQGYLDDENQDIANVIFGCAGGESSDPVNKLGMQFERQSSYGDDQSTVTEDEEESKHMIQISTYPSKNDTSATTGMMNIDNCWMEQEMIRDHETLLPGTISILPDEISYLGCTNTLNRPTVLSTSILTRSLKDHNEHHMESVGYSDSPHTEFVFKYFMMDEPKLSSHAMSDKPSTVTHSNQYVADWMDTIFVQSDNGINMFCQLNPEDVSTDPIPRHKHKHKPLDIRRYPQPITLHQPHDFYWPNPQLRCTGDLNHAELNYFLSEAYSDNTMLHTT